MHNSSAEHGPAHTVARLCELDENESETRRRISRGEEENEGRLMLTTGAPRPPPTYPKAWQPQPSHKYFTCLHAHMHEASGSLRTQHS